MSRLFPDKLKKLRKSKKKTQQDIADYLGITRQGYAKYENGHAEADYGTLTKLARLFDVSTDYLLGNDQDIDDMTNNEIDEELKELLSEMTVWYKDEPGDKKEKLRMLRKAFKLFAEDE